MALSKLTLAMQNLVNWSRAGFTKIDQTKPNIVFGNFTISEAEVAAAKTSVPDQQTMFNTWYRFSHSTGLTFPANSEETQAWAFDSATSSILNTTNSGTFIGMVSKIKYDNYDFEVKISSTAADDDIIGVLLAFYKDPDTGREYTLSTMRSPGGFLPLYGIVYNKNQATAGGEFSVAPGDSLVTRPNFTWEDAGSSMGSDGSLLLRVERRGNIIKVRTSQWATPGVLDESTLLTVDLTTDPILEKFIGESPYGIVAQSQMNSKWAIQDFTSSKDTIYDLVKGDIWTNSAGTWVKSPTRKLTELNNSVLVNPTTGKMFIMKDPNTIVQFDGTSILK